MLRQGETVIGVKTNNNSYYAENTIVCAGGLSRSLFQQAGIEVNNYFTYAQLIMTPPVDLELSTVVMPAVQQRFMLEAAQNSETEALWNSPYAAPAKLILDPGAVQFIDGSLCIGQISAITYNPKAKFNSTVAEAQIREQIGKVLPLLEDLPGKCHSCLVAFNDQGIALIGNLANIKGLYLFSGFTSTLVFAPVLARRFAHWAKGKEDKIIKQLQVILNQAIH